MIEYIKGRFRIGKSRSKCVIRFCDNCNKKDIVTVEVIKNGRRCRKEDIDLCRKCANSSLFRRNTQAVGAKSPKWKGGKYIAENRVRVYVSPGKWIYEHRLVMEKSLNRRLNNKEVVHHIDGNSLNNNIGNLYLFCGEEEHRQCHLSLQKVGFSLLGHKIWFDRHANIYTAEPQPQSIDIDVDVSFLSKLNIWERQHKGKYINRKSQIYYDPISKNKKYVHIVLAEKMLGRQLYQNEVVHHIDNNSVNNMINNLAIMTRSQHTKCHRSIEPCVLQFYISGLISFDCGLYSTKCNSGVMDY